MKLHRVKRSGLITAEAEHSQGPHNLSTEAGFCFSRFGNGKEKGSTFWVHASVEDAIAILTVHARQGHPKACQIMDLIEAMDGAETA